jgi:hypothetical protein
MRTIRTGAVGDLSLRLVERDKAFIGVIFDAKGAKKAQVEGTDADDVWRRLHDEAGKAHPKYFGFDGARARFLRFFPKGFHSAGYTNAERDYKVAAKQRLDATAPRTCCADRWRTTSFAPLLASRLARESPRSWTWSAG